MKKVLITGITGQDGAYLAKFLLNKEYRVFGLIRRVASRSMENLEYLGMTEDELYAAIDTFRQPHLWQKIDGQWKLKKQVS